MRVSQAAIGNAFGRGRLRNEIVVPVERVGREIGEPGEVRSGRVADRQRPAVQVLVEAGLGPQPFDAVLRNHGAVTGPARRIGRSVEIADSQHHLAPRGAAHPEVEPLEELALMVGTDAQHGFAPADRNHLDIAAIEGGIDRDVARNGALLPGGSRHGRIGQTHRTSPTGLRSSRPNCRGSRGTAPRSPWWRRPAHRRSRYCRSR